MINDSDRKRGQPAISEFYLEVGTKIRALRHQKGLKQDNVAQAVGLMRTSLSNIEKGRQRLMLHTFVGIAAQLEVQPHALLPSGTAVLTELGEKVPESMNPEDRDFIARAIGRGTTNETLTQVSHSTRSVQAAQKQQHQRSSGRRRGRRAES